MILAQDLTAIIIFWAIFGGIGASLLLPARTGSRQIDLGARSCRWWGWAAS
jgi:hypothetical protein